MKFEKEGGSQNGKPTSVTCGKRHYGECLLGSVSCFVCGKDRHKVRDCLSIASIGREDKKVPLNAQEGNNQNNKCFYALRTRGAKPDEDKYDGYHL